MKSIFIFFTLLIIIASSNQNIIERIVRSASSPGVSSGRHGNFCEYNGEKVGPGQTYYPKGRCEKWQCSEVDFDLTISRCDPARNKEQYPKCC